jgi:hypothetical protein
MLFIESKDAEVGVEKSLRTPLLEALQERGHVPLIRASRLHFFEQSLAGDEHVKELEQAVAERSDIEGEPYVRGDIFCSEDHAHFIIFGGEGANTLRAGIVYNAETADPRARLEAFCRDIQEAFDAASRESGTSDNEGVAHSSRIEWRSRAGQAKESFKGVSAEAAGVEPATQPAPARVAGGVDRARAFEILEDAGARGFLQRLSEAHADGRTAELNVSAGEPEKDALVARLAGAGLIRREVQVSCRKDGHSLFRLPSTDALAIVTASNAVCSECGTPIADERAEELLTPTPLAASLLKDGAWLLDRLRSTLEEAGIPAGATAARPSTSEGEAQVVADVCGEPFLFVMRDGDFTAAHARRALEGEADAHASRIVVIATGKIQDEARTRLREHARRRSRGGSETEAVFVEGLESAPAELRRAVERVSQDALTRELYELDASAGFNVGYALAARFRLSQRKGALQDLAASAAGALAGSLHEI